MEAKVFLAQYGKYFPPLAILSTALFWYLFALPGLVAGVLLLLLGGGVYLKFSIITIQDLEKQKKQLREEINIAERKFLQHKIDEKSFSELRAQCNEKIIALEAAIQTKKIETKIDSFANAEMQKLNKRRRNKMKQLIAEKEGILKALKLAEQKYYRRKIDSQSYKRIVLEQQKNLIRVESKMALILREQAREIMADAERKIALTEEEIHNRQSGEMADELYEQTISQKMQKRVKRYIKDH